ncbi:MAG: hypothetical protein SGPRY_003922 [Prymnesium sp.]
MASSALLGEPTLLERSSAWLSQLRWLAASSYGPSGSSKIVRASPTSPPLVTSLSHRLFGALACDEPLCRVLLDLLAAKQANGSDGGLFTLLLASHLLLRARESGIHPTPLAAQLGEAMEWCLRFLDSPQCAAAAPLGMSHLPSLLALLHSILSPKRVAFPAQDPLPSSALPSPSLPSQDALRSPPTSDARSLALLILRGFVHSIGSEEPSPSRLASEAAPSSPDERASRLLPGVRLVSLPGARLDESEMLLGVLLDTPLPAGSPHACTGRGNEEGERGELTLALYDINLEPTLPTHVSLHSSSNQLAADQLHDLLEAFASETAAADVSIVACQQRVSPALFTRTSQVCMLHARGVSVLPRLSLRHIEAVSRLSVGGLLRLSLAGKSYAHLLPPTTPHPRSLPVATLVLRSPNRAASEELHAVASCALATLGCALSQKRPRLLPGGGAIEVVLASKLREEAERSDGERSGETRRARQQAFLLLAEALERVVCALVGGGPAEESEVLSQLRIANCGLEQAVDGGGSSWTLYGWDVDLGCAVGVLSLRTRAMRACDAVGRDSRVSDDEESGDDEDGDESACVEEALLVDFESSKIDAMRTAVELASSLMTIDEVIIDGR